MLNKRGKKEIKRIIFSGFIIWIILSMLLYLITESFIGVYAISILVLLAILRFIVPEYIAQYRRGKDEKE